MARFAPLHEVPIDDATATRIMLADNRTSELSYRDTASLAEILQGLALTGGEEALAGTGYAMDDLDEIVGELEAGYGTAHDTRTPAEREAEYVASGIRSLVVPMGEGDYLDIVRRLAELRKAWDLESHADVVLRLLG